MDEVSVYLGLGSNLGDREANLRRALQDLTPSITLVKSSSIYETEPWGYKEQPQFLNCACNVLTQLSPQELIDAIKKVERAIGRQPTFPYGPRIIDVDILLYGDLLIDEESLVVPHPRLSQRAFVLIPLVELSPDLVHPRLGLTLSELLERVDGREGVKLWGPPVAM